MITVTREVVAKSRAKTLEPPLAPHTTEQPPESRPPALTSTGSSETGSGWPGRRACFTDAGGTIPTAVPASLFTQHQVPDLLYPKPLQFRGPPPAYSSSSVRFRRALMTSPSGAAHPLPRHTFFSSARPPGPLSLRLVERIPVPELARQAESTG